MNLIPKVKELRTQEGFLAKKEICFMETGLDIRLISALKKLPCSPDGVKLEIFIENEKLCGGAGVLEAGRREYYELKILEEYIEISAKSLAGAFYAIQTLRQLFKEEKVPCMLIKDWPDFAHRGFYHDVTRGKIPTMETLKKLIDDMAFYKLNSLQLYIEHVFEFEETKALRESAGYLKAEEIKELDAYCRENFIEFIPSLSTFGHLYELLQQPQFRHLQVVKEYKPEPNFWQARMHHHTIDPLNPESIEVIKNMIDQYAPHFASDSFNICCDETFDLNRYDDEGLDVGQIYVDFVKKIIAHVQGKGKKVMMWADILLQHPETIKELSDDIIFLNWYYHENTDEMEKKIALMAQSGKKQFVCPGTTTWNYLCERVKVAETNITKMIEIGHKYGAEGVLNTNWGDWGNPCSMELGMYGMVLGAEKSWSVETEPDDAFYGAVNKLLYGSETGVKSLKELSAMHEHVAWTRVCHNYFAHRYANGEGMKFISLDEVKLVQKAYTEFSNRLSEERWENDEFRKEMLIAAEGLCVMAEILARMAGDKVEPMADAAAWLERYRESWLRKNQPSELYRIEEMFEYLQFVIDR